MYHIDDLDKIVFCINAWDCNAPSAHFNTKREAEEKASKNPDLSLR